MTNTDSLKPAERGFVEFWRAADGHVLNGRDPGLAAARRSAIERFAEVGLPPEKSEAWKYTNIRRLVEAWAGTDPVAEGPDPGPVDGLFLVPGDAWRVVMVNGRFDEARSALAGLPSGVTVASIAEGASSRPEVFARSFGATRPEGADGFVALNTAFAQSGLFVHVPRGTQLGRPIEILFLSGSERRGFVQPRVLFVADEGSSARIVENWRSFGEGAVFTNAVSEFLVARDAAVDHVRIVDEHASSVHVHYLQARQLGSSTFSTVSFVFGGGTVRSDAYLLPDAEHCETHLNGFYFARGSAQVDNHTLVDHARPNCESNELYKGILDGQATGVFNGKVLVRQDAQKTNAYQSNKSVVLSETARMFSKPELEIYADDVKCSHGATTGRLDDDAFFYLRARGIPPAKARLLLLQAFSGDVFETVRDEALRERLLARLEALLYA